MFRPHGPRSSWWECWGCRLERVRWRSSPRGHSLQSPCQTRDGPIHCSCQTNLRIKTRSKQIAGIQKSDTGEQHAKRKRNDAEKTQSPSLCYKSIPKRSIILLRRETIIVMAPFWDPSRQSRCMVFCFSPKKLLWATLIKNCEPPDSGLPVLAMDKVPGALVIFWWGSPTSSGMFPPALRVYVFPSQLWKEVLASGPPVPAFLDLGSLAWGHPTKKKSKTKGHHNSSEFGRYIYFCRRLRSPPF